MPTHTVNWPNGTPNWVDCCFDDVKAAKDFYGKLFGWDIEFDADEQYGICLKNGHPAAAIAPNVSGEFAGAWCTFFAADDVDGIAQRVQDAGGTVVYEPTEIPDMGRTACFRDPEGALFGVWAGTGHVGFEIFNEPGSVAWNDLMTRDFEAAKRFYADVFGFTYEDLGGGYATFTAPGGERPVGGIHQADHLPPEAPAGWLVHFAVADRDSSISMVEELDGEVLMSFDTPFGPEAVVRGPGGEVFNVIALTAEPHAEPSPADAG